MTRPGWRHVRWAASILIVGAILAAALWPDALSVDMARASRGPMEVTLDEDGDTRVRDRFVVSAPVAGRLQRIELEPGDAVSKGRTVVARLMPAPPALPRCETSLVWPAEAANPALSRFVDFVRERQQR